MGLEARLPRLLWRVHCNRALELECLRRGFVSHYENVGDYQIADVTHVQCMERMLTGNDLACMDDTDEE
jgi:hypothetical protein